MTLPKFILELQDRENRDRYLQAIRTRYLLILGIWTFVVATYFLWGMTFYLIPIHIVVGLVLLINTVSYYLTRRWQFPLIVAIVSIIVDMIAITVLVYFTGGLKSMFFVLYLVQILGVSLFLNLPFSALMIAWAVVLFGTMKVVESAGLIATSSLFIPTTYSEVTDIIIWLIFQAMTFCLVAFLGGNLSNKLRFKERELERKRELEKLYEALQKAHEAKTRLLVNVSHNLRTPLTSILGFSELLLSKDESEPQWEEFAKIIHSESQHVTRVVDDILYLSQLEAGGVEWHMVETDTSKIVTESVNAAQDLAFKKGLKLTVDSRAASPLIYGDVGHLTDVMSRLIDNAIKFTIEGAIKVGITSEGDNACVSVSDTGIGIPADIKDRVFEPLEEIYKTEHKDVPQWTGLGLAICKAVIRHHQGKIWFESEPGRGSTFYFTLPQVRTR
jgi:signal transduction histidine kinase